VVVLPAGQGPYYGQAVWFTKFQPLPGARERHVKEIKGVMGVLEGWLTKQKDTYGGEGDGPWLVGNKLSFTDINFIMWQKAAERILGDDYPEDAFPILKEWLAKMVARPTVVKTFEDVLKHAE